MHVPGWFGRILFRLSRPHTVFIWLILPGWMSLHILFTSPGLLADPGPPQDRLHPPPGNIEESPPDQTSPELFQQRQALLPLLYRDRQQEAVYHEIRRAFETGRTIEALQLLQRLFDAEEDSFYWPSTTSAPISIRSAARDLFFSQTPGEWELYEQLNSAAASSLLAEAQDQKALSLYRELVRRFPFTSAGLQARRYLVYHAIDRHKFHEAHHHLHELITSEIHSQRILDSDHHLYHFLKYQIQPDSWNQHLSNDYELRTAMIERTSGRSYPILQVSRSELDENYFSAATHNRNQTVWREVTPPYLNKVWSASHMESSDSLLHQTMQYWEEEQQSELKPSAVGWKPVVVNETVYVRNYNDITAFNLHSGEMLWRYPCQSQFSPLLENFRPHGRMQSRSQFSQLTSELNLDELLVGNNLLGTITHDAKRLYLIDEVELKSLKAPIPAGVIAHTDNVFDESQARRRSNRLIALPLHQSEKLHSLPQKPSWTVGGVFDQKNTRQNNPLSGHFILGPPLVDGEVLYLLSEHEQQINLIALNAESGHVLWKQGIGWVEFMIDQDIYRSHRAATPVLAHNLLLCPCQTGMLVAIDRSSGSLRWVYDYRELNEIQQHRHWSRRRNSQRGHLGFDDHPVVQGNKVLYLPHQSESLHCLDLNTGKVLWKKLRKDADYIGAVDHNLAFIVGRKSCRGLTLRNGVEVWSNRLGTPSGRGIRAGHVYLLPLQSGQIASINIQTGEYAGLSHLHQRVTSDLTGTTDISPTSPEVKQIGSWSPGNLIASQNYVISAGPRGITVFPQAGSEIYQNPIPGDRAIELASGTGQLQDNSATSAHLRQAELNLILDRLEEAQQHLEHCLAVKDALILDERFQVEQLLKEVLYARMRTEPAQRDRHFQQLKSFASSNAEQGRLLMEEAEFQLMNGNHQASWQNVVAVAEFDLNLPLTDTTDSTLTITPRSWIPLMRERLLSTGGNTFLHLFELQTERCLDEALNSEDKHRLEIFLTLFGDGEPAAIAQMKLANRYLDEGQFHRAEQLWLNVREMSYPRLATLASQNLVSLWTRFGLYQLAANEIEQQSAGNLILSMQATSDNMLQLCLSQIQKKNENVLRVRIDEERWSEEGAELAGYRIALNPQSTSDFTLITKGSGHTGKLSLLDRQSGTILDDIDVPTGSLSNQLYRNQVCGSQLCLGGDSTAVGLSLMTREPVWELSSESNLRPEALSVCTVNSRFTILRNRHQIAVVDTGTGKILWQRDEISPPGNRINSGQAGVLGDDRALILLEDHLNYTVYNIRTGEELRQGQFSFDPSERHYTFGRKIFYFEPDGDDHALCLYDPLKDRYIIKRTSPRNVLSVRTTDEKLALLTPLEEPDVQEANRLLLEIIDPESERHLLRYEIKDDQANKLSFLRVFDDRDHYYVNLQHHDNSPDLPRQYYPAGDTLLENVTIRGKMLAFDKQTGKLLWKKTFQPASVIRLEPYRLPVLILVSRTRDRMNPNLHSLAVEAIDTRTGKSLGFHDEILTDRLVYGTYDPHKQRVSLTGHRTTIHLDLLSEETKALYLQATGSFQGLDLR